MYRLNKDTELSAEHILRYVDKHEPELQRRSRLGRYYRGEHDILKRSFADASKPNNRVVNPYANYITDIATGYFMGEPVTYNADEGGQEFLAKLAEIFSYNDEAAENSELAKDASIYGAAYELLYLDADKKIRFKKLPAETAICIYDDTLEEELLYFIRTYKDVDVVSDNVTEYIEVYSRSRTRLYKRGQNTLELQEEKEHAFGAVPLVVYQNNEDRIGDFETVIHLIDAYDKLESDSINDMEYFADAYLYLKGMEGTENEDIEQAKRNRVLLLPMDGEAGWLLKNQDGTYLESLKTRLDKSIHKFSECPAMTDEEFASNSSGVALKYKLMGLENATSKKERAFKKALQRRIELITNISGVMSTKYDYRKIGMTFTRNIPANLSEMAEVVGNIGHLLSEETQVGLLPIDVNWAEEKKRKAAERAEGYNIMGGGADGLLGSENSGE